MPTKARGRDQRLGEVLGRPPRIGGSAGHVETGGKVERCWRSSYHWKTVSRSPSSKSVVHLHPLSGWHGGWWNDGHNQEKKPKVG